MTSIRIIEPITFMHGAPVYYEAGTLTLNTMAGLTDDWTNYLWGFQKFLKRIETALATNGIIALTNIACTDPLASNFQPDNRAAFKGSSFSWAASTSNHNGITPLWRRYYKYQPEGCALPLYICIEGGWKGGNANSTAATSAVSRVGAHLSLSVSSGFSSTAGLTGSINTHFFPTGYDSTYTYNSGSLSYNGNLYFYSNGDDLYLSLLSLRNISKTGDYLILGRTSSGYLSPNYFMRGVILAKAQLYASGFEASDEPVALIPPTWTGYSSASVDNVGLNFTSLAQSARLVTTSGLNYIGPRTVVDECIEAVKTQGRIIAEPFTFTDLGGNYYLMPKLIRMVDIDRTTINIIETTLKLYETPKNLVILPLMMTTVSINLSTVNNVGATTLGMILDDTIIDG